MSHHIEVSERTGEWTLYCSKCERVLRLGQDWCCQWAARMWVKYFVEANRG